MRVIPSMFRALVCLISLRLSTYILHSLSHLLLHPPDLSLHLLRFGAKPLCALRRMRSLALWSTTHFSQVMSPSSSTTTTSQRPLKFSSRSPPATPGPRTCMTPRFVTTPSAERSLHHCSVRSEKNQRGRRQAYHSLEESLLSSQSLSVGHVGTGRPVNEFDSLVSSVRENPCRDSENEQIRILLERQKEQILAVIVEQRFRNTNSRPIIMTEEVFKS